MDSIIFCSLLETEVLPNENIYIYIYIMVVSMTPDFMLYLFVRQTPSQTLPCNIYIYIYTFD